MASSLHLFFDLDFLDFFGHAGIFDAIGVPFDAGPVAFGACLKAFLGPSVGAMKLNARRRASLRSSGGASRANRGETLDEPVCVNSDELGRAPGGSGRPCSLAWLASNILSIPSASVA